ncbi:SusC/RagA family TonB-linked outer membrane protein [Labilibacter marinus]|uniref:SusC/RagA family TonB-linked outer membrane protein n=1 Tax=Labilibacter marinus TaxID=1477105 RepID=UPI0013015B58|nr:TonB-dependent receptor [Labilibacter marinus]
MLILTLTISVFSVFAQKTSVTGTVLDNDGLGIPGVNVFVKGTTVGTITDFDGNYTLSLDKSEGVTLVYSFIGYQTQEIVVGNQLKINVALVGDTELLDDVVVVGFGTQKKKTVIGSVVQTTGEDLLQVGNVSTVSEALAGMLPGVSTMQAAGMPGSSNSTILIRGQSSWGSNAPLYMVDGVERDFNDLDPNEIESISVLKDASATAVYGVKGANGVILVTTKRGQKGKAKISFTANEGRKVASSNSDYMAEYATALEHYNMAAMAEGNYHKLQPQSDIDDWRNPNRDMDFYSYTNWIDYLLGTGVARSYNLNISGGNDFVKYFTSFGYNYDGDMFDIDEQEFIDPRTSQKRYNWRSNLDFQFTKTTSLKVNISGDFKDWHGNRFSSSSGASAGFDASGNTYSALYSNVQVGTPPILSNGELGAGDEAKDWTKANYLGLMERESENTKRSTRSNVDITFEQQFLKDFTFKAKVAYDYTESYKSSISLTGDQTSSPIYYRTNYRTGEIWQFGDPDKVEALPKVNNETLDGFSNNLYYEGSLNYNKSFGEHDVSALALFNRREAQNKVAFPKYEESWVGRLTYAYRDKYLFEFNGAYNGSDQFDFGKRFGFFPSLSLGWVASEEQFFKDNLSFIDFFKVRYSYGKVGNDILRINGQTVRHLYFDTYGTHSTDPNKVWQYKGYPGGFGGSASQQYMGTLYFEDTPANYDATWETAIKQNLGFDINILDSRLKTIIDLFDEKRTGILMERQSIPAWYGGITPNANIGETQNHGFDVELIWNDRIGSDWRYRLSANLSMSENRITERDDAFYAPEYQKQADKPIGWQTGYIQDDIHSSWDDIYIGTQSSHSTLRPGDFTYVDYNGDGIISNLDRVPIGEPSYASNSFAFNVGVTYKQLSLNAVFNGVFAISKNLDRSYLWEHATTGGDLDFRMLNTEMFDFWSPTNLGASRPGLRTVDNIHNSQQSTYTRRRSDFIRLKNIELKYKFSKNILDRTGFMDNLEIFVNGNNLITWQKLPEEFDPEARSLSVYPIAKRYNVGLRASF